MFKKRVNIALIIIVAILWVTIIYRIIGYTRNPIIENTGFIPEAMVKNDPAEDTILIYNNYRDPFLRRLVQSNDSEYFPKLKPLLRDEKSRPVWPHIIYTGLVNSMDKKITIALISIDNKNELLSVGDEYAGVRIIAVYADSVLLSLHDEIKTFKKP